MILSWARSRYHPTPLARRVVWRLLGASLVMAGAHAVSAERPPGDLEAGRKAYGQYCARCHGLTGTGDGVDAKRFYPRPRDLAMGRYKFRSTESGTPPTDEDLFQTIAQGLPGSNMPDWQHLDASVRWHLVDYLKSLSTTFQETPPALVKMTDDPGPKGVSLEKGKAVFQQLGCAACHGAQGRANGTSAAGLVDEWNMAIRPADLTQGWAYRGGNDPRAIAMRVLAGIDGSGMPSYAGAAPPEDVWQLAHYVRSLQEPAHWNMIARVQQVEGTLPSSPDDARWASVESTDVRVRNVVTPEGEWRVPPTIRAVRFQAVANGEGMAFHVMWDDPTEDRGDSPDGLALLLKPAGAHGDVVTLQAWPYAGAPMLDLCYWSAKTGAAFEALASDYVSVLSGAPAQTTLNSVAKYEDGRWHLVVQRALVPANPGGAAAITPEAFAPVAFAIWDGGNPTARAVSPWLEIAVRANGAARGKTQ